MLGEDFMTCTASQSGHPRQSSFSASSDMQLPANVDREMELQGDGGLSHVLDA